MNREMVVAEWRRAAKSLGAAGVLLRAGYSEDSISRTYYAVLHAVKSALFVHDVAVSRHAAARSMFGLHLVRSGEIEREWAGVLAEGLDDRLRADYGIEVGISSEEADDDHEQAKAFLDRIRRYLLAKGLTEQELAAERRDG